MIRIVSDENLIRTSDCCVDVGLGFQYIRALLNSAPRTTR